MRYLLIVLIVSLASIAEAQPPVPCSTTWIGRTGAVLGWWDCSGNDVLDGGSFSAQNGVDGGSVQVTPYGINQNGAPLATGGGGLCTRVGFCDFSQATGQSLATDGTYTITPCATGSMTAVKVNSANDATGMTLSSTNGIVQKPNSNGAYYETTRTIPGIEIPLSQFTQIYLGSHLRVMATMSVGPLVAGQSFLLSIENPSQLQWSMTAGGYSVCSGTLDVWSAVQVATNETSGCQSALTSPYPQDGGYDTLILDVPSVFSGNITSAATGRLDGGLVTLSQQPSNAINSNIWSLYTGTLANWDVLMGSNGNLVTVTWKSLEIDVCQ